MLNAYGGVPPPPPRYASSLTTGGNYVVDSGVTKVNPDAKANVCF